MPLKDFLFNKMSKKENVINQYNVKEKNSIEPKNETEFNAIMIETINNFFPTTGEWGSECFKQPNDLLQSNLRNNKFLAKMLLKKANLSSKYYDKVLEFINSSVLFMEKVHEYEQTIVKWQIDWISNGGENWLADEKLGGDLSLYMSNCDIAFRKGVVDTLLAIGLDEQAIEEGLEKNANMWRDYYIKRAFKLTFEPLPINILENEKEVRIPEADEKLKQSWIKMRKFEYYCNHKRSVDLYGSIEPDMTITLEEIKELNKYLRDETFKRLDFIQQYSHNFTQKRTLNK